MQTSGDYDSNRNLLAPPESRSATTIAIATICNVAERKLETSDQEVSSDDVHLEIRFTEAMKKRVVDLVKAEMKAAKERGVAQRAFAEQLHLKQPSINRVVNHGHGIGLDFVLALRTYLKEVGRPQTIDQILGLEEVAAPSAQADPTDPLIKVYGVLVERYNELMRTLKTIKTADDISAKKKKNLLEQAEDSWYTAGGNRDMVRIRAARKKASP